MTTTKPVAIITGAGSGIGRATAVRLASDPRTPHAILLVGRREDPLKETAALLPDNADADICPADIAHADDCKRVIDTAINRFARIDVLVNNAGAAPLHPIDQTTPDIIDQTLAVNTAGPAYLIHYAWTHMVKQRSGCIVNVSTIGTLDPFAGFFAYAAAKSAVNLMARSCANEGKRHNIRAFAVAPGAVETTLLRENFPHNAIPPERCLAPDDVAQVIADCVLGNRDQDVGNTIPVPSP